MVDRRVLGTRRLVLRPFAADHVDALHRILVDPAVCRYLLDEVVVSREWVVNEVTASEAMFRERGCGLWVVCARDSGDVIGFCGYREFYDPPELQLVCGLAPEWWGHGLATEAAEAVIRYGFDVLGFDQVAAETDAPNTASVRLMERLGMRFRERTTRSGRDTLCYLLTRQDWDARRTRHG